MNLFDKVADLLIRRAQRTPYFNLEGYMERNWLVRIGPRNESGAPRWFGARIHHILRSDSDRHLHDHPWPYLSLILRGGYTEVREYPVDMGNRRDLRFIARTIKRLAVDQWDFDTLGNEVVFRTRIFHGAGSLLFRRSTDRHRLIVDPGASSWSLFMTGPKVKTWGFYTENGFVNWRDYEKVNAPMQEAA